MPIYCEICKRDYPNGLSYQAHLLTKKHARLGQKVVYHCKACNYKIHNKTQFNIHLNSVKCLKNNNLPQGIDIQKYNSYYTHPDPDRSDSEEDQHPCPKYGF